MKIIAFYLPQFHTIPENDKWWGEGFTEWVNVKNAFPMFEGHLQPRTPLNQNYYDLSDKTTMRDQVMLAKKYGIYGFCFYHYWFGGKLLLEKPVENYLSDKNLDLPFCICWANENWTNSWVSKDTKILMEQKYGDVEDWKTHFYYLLPYLRDSRYITTNGKPLIVIYKPALISCLEAMIKCWQTLAVENGLEGIDFAYQSAVLPLNTSKIDSLFTYRIEYQPAFARFYTYGKHWVIIRAIKSKISAIFEKLFHFGLEGMAGGVRIESYDDIWNRIINMPPTSPNSIPGAFVNWDNTPRKQERGLVIQGMTPEKFGKYLTIQINRARNVYKKDMIFMFAWNEWAEGGFLEPDEAYGYEVLEAVKKALVEADELHL